MRSSVATSVERGDEAIMTNDGGGSSFDNPNPRDVACTSVAVCASPNCFVLSVLSGSCICFCTTTHTSVLGRTGHFSFDSLHKAIKSSSIGTPLNGSRVKTKNRRSEPAVSSNANQRNRSSVDTLEGISNGTCA